MTNKIRISLIVTLLLSINCSLLGRETIHNQVKEEVCNCNNKSNDEERIINVDLENGRANITFRKDFFDQVSLRFDTQLYKHIKATLTANGNVRFSTVGFKNNMDGPYGQEIDLPLNETGIYILNLSPNLMADGDPNKTITVTVDIELSN